MKIQKDKDLKSDQKHLITNYILSNLSSKGIKTTEFCKATGLTSPVISHMKKAETQGMVSNAVWKFLKRIHDEAGFDMAMQGKYKFEELKRVYNKEKIVINKSKTPGLIEIHSKITVGAAIDMLIANGAKIINISIEL